MMAKFTGVNMKIVCNNVPRQLIYGYQLSEKEKADFDYIKDVDSANFFRYRGAVYDPAEFLRIEKAIAPHCPREGWEKFHGYQADTLFSAVLIRYTPDFESVIVAWASS